MGRGSDPRWRTLLDVLSKIDGRVAIEIQRTPDPDAMGSALAVKHIGSIVNPSLDMDITHYARLSHPMNILMKKKLGMRMVGYEDGKVSPDQYDHFIFVDHSGKTSVWYTQGVIPLEKVVGLIDHHDVEEVLPEGMVNLVHTDRRVIGATSSIIADYLMGGLAEELNMAGTPEYVRTATGLILGIRSDTLNLLRAATDMDHKAHAYLAGLVDMGMIDQIENPQWPKRMMDLYGAAITNRLAKDGVVVAMAGYIQPEEHDALAIAADQLLREEGVHTVLVAGIQPQIYDISLRTKSETLNIGKFLEDRFGKVEKAMYGGKDGAGGVQIPHNAGSDLCYDGKDMNAMKEHMATAQRTIYNLVFMNAEAE